MDPSNHRVGLSLRRVDSLAYADMDWQSLLDQDILVEGGDEDQVQLPEDDVVIETATTPTQTNEGTENQETTPVPPSQEGY